MPKEGSVFPRLRVDLSVDDGVSQKEIPFTILFVGDFGPNSDRWSYDARRPRSRSISRSQLDGRNAPAPRPRVPLVPHAIDKDTFDEVFARLAPERSDGYPATSIADLDGAPGALWRALHWAVQSIEYRENIRSRVLDLTKEELVEDLARGARVSTLCEAADPSRGYCGGLGPPPPVGLIVGCFEVGPADLELLARCAEVAELACAPFVTMASPALFGSETFSDLPRGEALATHFAGLYGWSELRAQRASRFAALCLPELEVGDRRAPASFAFASVVARSFQRYRWGTNCIGPDGEVESARAVVEISERHEYELSLQGFTTFHRGHAHNRFFSAPSLRRSARFPATDLPYTLAIARVVHCLRWLARGNPHDAVAPMRVWLDSKTCELEHVSLRRQSRQPFHRSRLDVHERDGERVLSLMITPRATYMGERFSLELELPLRR